jgi:hypothetical protein
MVKNWRADTAHPGHVLLVVDRQAGPPDGLQLERESVWIEWPG